MLRKGLEPLKGDREVLLDLDYGGEAQTTDSYGSLQNGCFIPPRYLSAIACDEDADGDDNDPIDIHFNTRSTQPLPQLGNYFTDGRTKIDFVLVWEVRSRRKRRGKGKDRGEVTGEDGEAVPTEENSRSERRKAKLAQWREKFVQNLECAGLLMEKEETANEKKTIHFLKLSAPWDVMVYHAEELCLRAPLQAQPHHDLNTSARVLSRLCIPNAMTESVPNRPLDYYTCAFRKSKMNRFLGCDNHETYFTNTQRHRVVYEILARTVYGKRKRAEVGVDRLVNEGAYTAAFPLHEGPFQLPRYEIRPDELNQRQVLHYYWSRWCKWYKYQPLDHIREYFGEKIALYFAWLGYYTAWLLPAAVVGTLVFVSGVMSMGTNTPAKEICNSSASYLMCPLCNTCKAWNMSEICTMAKLGYLFDHPGTVFFSVFMSFWAVTFLEYWKRKMATLAHHWDCMDFHEEEERPRPEFAAMAPSMEQNPVTGVKEPYFPEKTRLSRMFTGSMVIIMMLCVVMIFLVTVVMCRGIISVMMYHTGSPVLRTEAGTIANISSSIVNLGLILLMGRVYTALAEQLTKWEMHRTQTQYDNAFIFKVFIFQFVNFYSSPFYVAFFKGRFVGYPTNYGTLFGMRNEDCGPGGCLIELAEQLFIIMVGKQLINNIQEFIIPKVKAWRQKRSLAKVLGGKSSHEPRRWEEDYQLVECEGLFEEYLEMVLQFGFITIFVAAFPLAPLFALLNNWVEIRLDAHKFVCEYRRPVAERAQNIGVWFNILEALSHLSVIANAFLIAFTSEFLPRLLYQYKFDNELSGYVNFTLAYAPLNFTEYPMCRYKAFRDNNGDYTLFYWELLAVRLGFIIAFEHVVFFVLRAIDWIVPDVPESLELKMKRERYLAKQALAENQEALLVSRGRGAAPATPGTSSPVNVAGGGQVSTTQQVSKWHSQERCHYFSNHSRIDHI
ncbi:anoctamin-7 isoform X1 [Thunnus albacares]|uniref:anoctamin-7 isoform X1 n=1 Tax=Thunnus albacares TaxID=8236 RepID=UPI001CF63B41|nr:anoctamin-7 isoform X1 [Thunnus albacares]